MSKETEDALNILIAAEIHPLTSRNIVLMKEGYLQVGNEMMQPLEIGQLAIECKLIKDTRMWGIMQENIRFEAFKRMSEATTSDGMLPGKWMLHDLNAIQGVLDAILSADDKIAQGRKNVSKTK